VDETRLADRVALITGVSRRNGIGFAIARRLLDEAGTAFVHSWTPHDAEQGYGADPAGIDGVVTALGHPDRRAHLALDLADPGAAAHLVDSAARTVGPLNTLVVNHVRSSLQSLDQLTAGELDESWAVNVRATLLLVQAFAAQYPGEVAGRVVLFTSGQHRAPMSDELPYTVTKGAIHQMTASLAEALIDRGITVNCVNPGPTDTGWADPATDAVVRKAMPRQRWNTPEEAAAVVTWLLSADAASVTGQVIDAEGGFRRHRLGQ
jgi:3-oxoacyl-[acyl-carrier protein] reductase